MHVANLVSLVMFLGFVLQYVLVETPRTQVLDLDPKNVSYCELTQCPRIQGLELNNANAVKENLSQQASGVVLELDFTNHLMLQGVRELWLRVESADGELLELARVEIALDLKNRTIAKFLLTSSESDISGGKLLLGY